jgi:hypothetical protein
MIDLGYSFPHFKNTQKCTRIMWLFNCSRLMYESQFTLILLLYSNLQFIAFRLNLTKETRLTNLTNRKPIY